MAAHDPIYRASLFGSADSTLLDITPANITSRPGYSFTRATPAWQTNENGVIEEVPAGTLRTAHYIDGVRHWLTEPASTNLHKSSEALDSGDWATVRSSITANATTAPDGATTAEKLVEDTSASTTHLLLSVANITVTDATTHTTTVFAKAAERTWFQLQEGQGVTASANFDLSNGVVGTVSGNGSPSASIEAIGSGWYRCRLTWTSSGTAARIRIYLATGDGTTSYTGDGSSGAYFWGGQMEPQPFPTSYIPTSGSTVTRNADELQATGVDPQESTALIDGTELGAISTAGAKLLQLGNAAPLLAVMEDSGGYIERHNDSTNTDNTAALSAAPDYGDRLELAAQLSSAGTPTLVQSINSAAEESATDATPNASLQGSWGDQNLYIGWDGTDDHAAFAFRRILIVTGVQSLETMRTSSVTGKLPLTPIAAADHSDTFQVATRTGVTGFQPYMDLPRGRRGRIDFLSKRTDTGRLTVRVLDKSLTPPGNFQRWVTAFVGDEDGRRQCMGKAVYVEESLDGGSSFDPFYLGNVQRVNVDSRNWVTLELHDLSSELSVKTFRGRPTATYANKAPLLPVGLVDDYGPFETTPMVPANVGVGSAGGSKTVDTIEVDESEFGLSDADVNLTLITKALNDIAGQRVSGFFSPAGSVSSLSLLDGVVARVRLIGGSRDGEEGFMYLEPFVVDSNPISGAPVSENIHGYINTEFRDGHAYLRSIAVTEVDAAFAVSNWDTTTVEFAIIGDGEATETLPILIDDVHPVQLWSDLLDGKFGPFDRDGTVRQTTPKDETSFSSLIADASFPLFRAIVTETAFSDEWIEKHILQPYNLAYYRDGEGRVVPVDLRSRDATGVPTIGNADVVANPPATSSTDLSSAVTDVEITYYGERRIPRSELSATEEIYPEVPTFGLESVNLTYRVVNVGNPDVPPTSPIEIDALGYRLSNLEEMEQGVEKHVYFRGRFDALIEQLRVPYGAGAEIISLPCRRTATVEGISQGDIAIVDVDEIADPSTNRRGGPRLGRVLERIEDGPIVGLTLLDLGVNVTAGTPTLGTMALVSGENDRSVDVPVTALNGNSDPVVVHVAVTAQSVGTRPAEDSPLWFQGGKADAVESVIVRDLPANSRVWARGRSEPNPESGGGSLLPSAWVFPSNSSVDTAGITAPSGLSIDTLGGVFIEASFTPGDTDLPTEVWLDGVRYERLPPGTTEFEFRFVNPNTTYNSPGLQVRHVDPVTGGVSAFSAAATFTTLATAEDAPAYIGAVLLVGESG